MPSAPGRRRGTHKGRDCPPMVVVDADKDEKEEARKCLNAEGGREREGEGGRDGEREGEREGERRRWLKKRPCTILMPPAWPVAYQAVWGHQAIIGPPGDPPSPSPTIYGRRWCVGRSLEPCGRGIHTDPRGQALAPRCTRDSVVRGSAPLYGSRGLHQRHPPARRLGGRLPSG